MDRTITQEDVRNYYDSSPLWDYDFMWGGHKHFYIHFGYNDKKYRTHFDGQDGMNETLADSLSLVPGMTILDAGCGVGGSAVWLAKKFGVRVVGITISERQKSIAENLAQKRGVSHLVAFRVADYTKTNFPPESFDVVWALESVCYALNKRDFVKESKRLLKPQGSLILGDAFKKKTESNPSEENIMRIIREGFAIPNFITGSQFSRLLKEEGLYELLHRDITKNVFPSSGRMYYWGLITSSLLTPMKFFRNIPSYDFRRTCIIQHTALRQGLWTYEIFHARK